MHDMPSTPSTPLFGSARGPAAYLPPVVAGLVVGTIVVILSLSFAVLIFTGPLAPYVKIGIGIALFTAVVTGSAVTLLSSYEGTIAFPQDKIAPLLAMMVSFIIAEMPDADPETLFLTAVAALALATFVLGIFLTALGTFKLGGLIRFIPYPVIGGFLAGTGYLLVRGSFKVMAGKALTLENLSALLTMDAARLWIPGLFFAVVMVLSMRRWRHFLTMPILLLGGISLFYIVLAISGYGVAEARAAGFILESFPAGDAWSPLTIKAFTGGTWSVVFHQWETVGTILIISGIGVLLNCSGLELASGRDMDLNRELKVAGAANLLSGLGGGIIGFPALSISMLPIKMGVRSRITGIVSVLLCAAVLFFGAGIVSYFPKPILGGLLMFLGLNFLVEWVYDAWFKMNRADYTVIIIILTIVGAFGYLPKPYELEHLLEVLRQAYQTRLEKKFRSDKARIDRIGVLALGNSALGILRGLRELDDEEK